MQFVLPLLFTRCARKQQFVLFAFSVRIAACNSVHCSQESVLERSNPLGMKDYNGLRGRMRVVVRWAMLGAQSRMGNAQHRVTSCDA